MGHRETLVGLGLTSSANTSMLSKAHFREDGMPESEFTLPTGYQRPVFLASAGSVPSVCLVCLS